MNAIPQTVAFLATAGFGEGGVLVGLFFVALPVLLPLAWIFHGGWFMLLGLCVLAIDIVAILMVDRFGYRMLVLRWHFPKRLVGFLVLLGAMIAVSTINFTTTQIACAFLSP